jgi:hypothetical protein
VEYGNKPPDNGALIAEAEESERPRRKEFVEPEVSFPVDVLEATTFFQLADTGSTT